MKPIPVKTYRKMRETNFFDCIIRFFDTKWILFYNKICLLTINEKSQDCLLIGLRILYFLLPFFKNLWMIGINQAQIWIQYIAVDTKNSKSFEMHLELKCSYEYSNDNIFFCDFHLEVDSIRSSFMGERIMSSFKAKTEVWICLC